jgi:SAM-dependent methyltransferase
MTAETVIWHELECAGYRADLPVWLQLAAQFGDPVLEIGAGTGRVTLALAVAGHAVDAVERDAELAAELASRSRGLPVAVICADACSLSAPRHYPLCIAPMQVLHLLENRDAFLERAADLLAAGGILAAALLGDGVEPFDVDLAPDEVELDGVRYVSRPTALRNEDGTVVLERRHETIAPAGARSATSLQRLAPLDRAGLEREAATHGFEPLATHTIAPTSEFAGSEVVVLRRPS